MSTSLAFYLKYRPQSLDELVGQDAVKKTLLPSFQNNKLSHAYLFVGPRGTGKTSTARILAKMVNCEKGITSETGTTSTTGEEKVQEEKPRDTRDTSKTRGTLFPCNECATCLSITDGSNLDLIEIDAASNRGIEDIRSLRDKIKLAPTSAKKKVYIIDEVHMLTQEAFNALLKTLEEPPAHALFILATTESAKMPTTILSRVQRLDFKLATAGELLEALKKIVESEKINIDEEALKVLVKRSDGSFRDGVKLLDQIASIGGKITTKAIEESLKSSHFDDTIDLLQNLSSRNAATGLLIITKQVESGIDIKELLLSLMDAFRSLVMIKNGVGEQLVKSHLTEDKYQKLEEMAKSFSGSDLVRALDILQSALEKLKFASIPSLPLELAIVEICGEESSDKIAILDSPSVISSSLSLRGSSLRVEDLSEAKDLPIHLKPASVGDSSSQTPQNDMLLPSDLDSPDILKLKEKWTFVLETVRSINFSLEALLRSINVSGCTESSVVMEVPYSFHQRILEVPKNRDLLEGVFSDILGRSIRISIILGSRPPRKDDIANIEVAEDDEIIRAAAEIFNSDTVN